MTCLAPRVIRATWKGAKPSQVMSVPCGKCIGCLKDRQNAWIYRLQRENYVHKHGYFVTLTYDEKNVPFRVVGTDDYIRYKDWLFTDLRDVVISVYPKELTNYFKRLRKMLDFPFKMFSCAEYGDEFGRPHYHFLLWHDGDPVATEYCIEKAWNKGFVQIKPITDSRIAYVTKYLQKGMLEAPPDDNCYPCFSRASHGLGIQGFLEDEQSHYLYSDDYMKQCILNNGSKIPTPRYLRRKFYKNETFEESNYDKQNYQRNKRERERFQRYVQDMRLANSQLSFSEIISSYNQNNDPSRVKRNSDLIRAKRKGM